MNGPTVTWLEPPAHVCALKNDQLVVVGGSTKKVEGRHLHATTASAIGVDKTGPAASTRSPWKTAKLKKGAHHLTATLDDAAGRKAAAGRAAARLQVTR